MAGKGAPKDNQYAKKEHPGRTIGLYITGEEWMKLSVILESRGEPHEDKDIAKFARSFFKQALQNEDLP